MLMLFGKEIGKESKEITLILVCSARVKFNGRRKKERCGKKPSLRSGIDVL